VTCGDVIALPAVRTESARSGDLAPGEQLPAERDLADDWGVAYQTVRRAMRELRERGIVVSVVGKGTFIAPPGKRG
jgi:GntR family transcriptional regulator